MHKLLIMIFLVGIILLVLWIIYFGGFKNLSFFKLHYRILSIFSTPKKMDKLNNESIENAKENKKEITIIIHGAVSNYYADVYGAAVWYKEQGLNVVSFNYDFKASPDISAQKLSLYVDDILEQTGTEKVNIVGICLGGNVAQYYAEKFDGAKNINKLVTVLTPLKPMPEKGFFYRVDKLMSFNPDIWNEILLYMQSERPVDNTLHIYSTNDIIIPTKYQVLESGNFIPVDIGHSPLMNVDPKILNIVLDFINKD